MLNFKLLNVSVIFNLIIYYLNVFMSSKSYLKISNFRQLL